MNYAFKKSDFYLLLLYFAFAIPISALDYAQYTEKWKLAAEVTAYSLLTAASMYVFVYIIFARFFPRQKYVQLFFWTLVLFFLGGAMEINITCLLFNCKESPFTFMSIYRGFSYHLGDVGLLSALMLGKKLYDAQLHFVQMEKEKKESELRFLKAQIDPHFLFNNLNTVDALIDQDPKAAKKYINRLSQLYRYLISSKDFEVVPLEEELEFAKNYMYLIESRYGNAYLFNVEQDSSVDRVLIPPGSLQTLLENIVKHNQGSEKKPIYTNIKISPTGIQVTNDLRAKNRVVDSTGIGLKNLQSRYKLLTDEALNIKSNEKFTVELPLIKEVE